MLILQEIMGYFLIGFIVLAILAICYFPVYVILRKKVPLSRQLAWLLLGSCVLVICSATFLGRIISCILDGHAVLATKHSLNLIPFRMITEVWEMGIQKQITQNIANILMFVPLGFILPVTFRKTKSFRNCTLYLATFSLTIEVIQYFIGRACDIDDLILNTLGGILGYLLYRVFASFHHNIRQEKKDKEPQN